MSVSVVIPSFNAASFLTYTVNSLLPQLGKDDEIIIVDDGSTDDTPTVVAKLNDDRIVYLWQENSGGPAQPRNRGCSAAKGEYVFLFDSDDLALPNKLQASVQALEDNPAAGFVFTNFNMIDTHGSLLHERYADRYAALSELLDNKVGKDLYYIPGKLLLGGLFQANFIGTSSVAMRKSVWEKTNGFDESLLNLDDRDMWLQLCLGADAVFLNHSLHNYRNRENSISKQRVRDQLLERLVVANKFKERKLTRSQKRHANSFLAKNYLNLGYIDFHEVGDRTTAFKWFYRSFKHDPSLRAFKGVIKSGMPQILYKTLR